MSSITCDCCINTSTRTSMFSVEVWSLVYVTVAIVSVNYMLVKLLVLFRVIVFLQDGR